MPMFRKKPVTIEAERYDGSPSSEGSLLAWIGAAARSSEDGIIIHTMEGDHLATPGDWIIRGVEGEFYPCKPSVFDATYEPAE